MTSFTDPGIDAPVGITAGPGRRPVVHQRPATRSGGSPRPGRSSTSPTRPSRVRRPSPPVRTATCGSPTHQLDRADHAGRRGVELLRRRISSPAGITAGPDGALWFTNSTTTRSGGSPRPGSVTTSPIPRSSHPWGIAAGPDGALWFTNELAGTLDRAHHHAGAVSNYTGPGLREPEGITTGPDGNLWFTNRRSKLDRADHHRRGGHQFTDPALAVPRGITAGPDGALWFTDLNATRSGASPPPG